MQQHSFVILNGQGRSGTRILDICGTEYIAAPGNTYIDDAINLAARWSPDQITYKRIIHLYVWIKDNDECGYKIPFRHIQDIQGCKEFVESCIRAEFGNSGERCRDSFNWCMEENETIFP
jgi:hypothetical protein